MVKIGLLGHGVVGTGVVEVIKNKADQLPRLTGEQIEVKSVLVRHNYDVDYKEVFRQAKETGTILEINNASLIPGGFRDGSQENVKEILRMSMEEGISVVLGSDAHFYTGIGDFSHALALLKEVGFPEELVLNTDPVRFLASLKQR